MNNHLLNQGSDRTGLPRCSVLYRVREIIYRTYTIIALFILLCSSSVYAQPSLTIVDALPPYSLNPVLLSNGHFSISTNYTTPINKSLIYREDGTSGRPVNYTSHFHVRVDDIVYQLNYELDTATQLSPPPHPIITEQIFRDTINNIPRINARSFAKLIDGDTLRFVFTMEPVKRSSGAFIRMTLTVVNTTSKVRKIGALMLIDTKIGNNDRAPIATSFGYSSTEKQYDKGVAQGVPDFWLGMEGTPIAPGLVARGNLIDAGLVEPDRLIFGNWTDYTSQGIKGLASTQWKERNASSLDYTDSAILLIWDENNIPRGQTVIKASTEIGIVDSLSVAFGGGSPGGGGYNYGSGGFGVAGAGTCLSVEAQRENPCGVIGYNPYSPDSLQAMYIVTNLDSVTVQNNVRVVVTNYPPGIVAGAVGGTVIPANLVPAQSGVAVLSLVPMPRLQAQSYRVPVAVLNSNNTPVLFDTIDVCVPGLLGVLEAVDKTYPPVCPQSFDTLTVQYKLKGKRCLQVLNATLTGTAADVAQFSVVRPLPLLAQADSLTIIRIRYAPMVNNNTPVIGVVLELRDYDVTKPGDTTNVVVFDTAYVTAPSREAEFLWARTTDTLDFGRICVGDTATGDWDAINVGGCAVTIQSGTTRAVVGASSFAVAPATVFPSVIPRSERDTVQFTFTPLTAGTFISYAIIQSPNAPFLDTLVLRGIADVPRIVTSVTSVMFDTLCINASDVKTLQLSNPTACPIVIDSVRINSITSGWSVSPSSRFTIPPNTNINVSIRGVFTTPGDFTGTVTAYSAIGNTQTQTSVTVVTRQTSVSASVSYGDVLVDSTKLDTLRIYAQGTTATVVSVIDVMGLHASEYSVVLPIGITLPHIVQPNDSLVVQIRFTPKDIEQRSASVNITLNKNVSCSEIQTARLIGRGTQPILDVRSRTIALGRVCAGAIIDTTIEIRNPGNAPLLIQSVRSSGDNAFTLAQVNGVVVPPDSVYPLRVQYKPSALGNQTSSITLKSNGKWLTPTDTTLTMFATGIVCGELRVDTVEAVIGVPVEIPIRFIPSAGSTLTGKQLVQMMNTSTSTAMNVAVQYDSTLLRVTTFKTNDGMIGNLLPSVLQTTFSNATLSVGNSVLQESDILAVLRGDVLLGTSYQTPLTITKQLFANGNSNVTLKPGLLRAQYCGYDNRIVSTQSVRVMLRVVEQQNQNYILLYSDSNKQCEVYLVNMNGERVATLNSGIVQSGNTMFQVDEDIPNGMYIVVASTPTDITTTSFTVIK